MERGGPCRGPWLGGTCGGRKKGRKVVSSALLVACSRVWLGPCIEMVQLRPASQVSSLGQCGLQSAKHVFLCASQDAS